ncbi:hypothetical protein CISG_06850 [Coccidioides immitis RMSCC 3703]|uniref:Uncharacterized protein n=2 Tax=Coccidioides immitis TaxID=5501 RepID=A0A0J8QYG4_COCIT|nr:hypothetical protein CIRG_08703 [Coccidioides immitis RMSCC 2394]KMU77939.1 hypothetical protein CISG_06850 [Coccidioides immitis RMSCC 3703]
MGCLTAARSEATQYIEPFMHPLSLALTLLVLLSYSVELNRVSSSWNIYNSLERAKERKREREGRGIVREKEAPCRSVREECDFGPAPPRVYRLCTPKNFYSCEVVKTVAPTRAGGESMQWNEFSLILGGGTGRLIMFLCLKNSELYRREMQDTTLVLAWLPRRRKDELGFGVVETSFRRLELSSTKSNRIAVEPTGGAWLARYQLSRTVT